MSGSPAWSDAISMWSLHLSPASHPSSRRTPSRALNTKKPADRRREGQGSISFRSPGYGAGALGGDHGKRCGSGGCHWRRCGIFGPHDRCGPHGLRSLRRRAASWRVGSRSRDRARWRGRCAPPVAEIEGAFEGEIFAESLLLAETARVKGTFETKRLAIREGAVVEGAFNRGKAAPVEEPHHACPRRPSRCRPTRMRRRGRDRRGRRRRRGQRRGRGEGRVSHSEVRVSRRGEARVRQRSSLDLPLGRRVGG